MAAKAKWTAVIVVLVCWTASAALATPSGVTVSINQGAAKSSSDVVWLYLTATTGGGDMEMRVSNWGFGFSSPWEPYFQKKLWCLEPAGTLDATKGVTVQVRDASGTAEASDSIFVTSPLNPNVVAQKRWHYSNFTQNAVPLPGGPTGMCFDGLNLWVCKYDDDYLAKIRAPDRTLLTSVSYTTGSAPIYAVSDGMHIYTVNYSSGNVTKREMDGTLITTLTVGTAPHRACFDGTYIWVPCDGDDKLYRIDASTDAVSSTLAVGSDPHGIAFDGNNLWVAIQGDNVVKKIRPSDAAVLGTYPVGNTPEDVLFDGTNIWVTNRSDNSVTKLRAKDGANQGTFSVGLDPVALAFDGSIIWVANYAQDTVSKLRAADGTAWGTVHVPNGPWGLAFDGANVWVSCYLAGEVVKL